MLHKAEIAHLPALAEGLGAFEVDVVQIAVVDDVAVAEHRPALRVQAFYTEQHTGRSSPYSGVHRLSSWRLVFYLLLYSLVLGVLSHITEFFTSAFVIVVPLGILREPAAYDAHLLRKDLVDTPEA